MEINIFVYFESKNICYSLFKLKYIKYETFNVIV